MISLTPIIKQDLNGVLWRMTVVDDGFGGGIMDSVVVGSGTVSTIIIGSWQLQVDTLGRFQFVSPSAGISSPRNLRYLKSTPSGKFFILGTDSIGRATISPINLILPPQCSVADTEILSVLEYALLEPTDGTWSSGMWTQQEVLDYMNDVQSQFLGETGINCTVNYIDGTAQVARYDLDQDTVHLRRAAWREGGTGTGFVELALVSETELDLGVDAWESQSSPVPLQYMRDFTPPLNIQLQPKPGDIGTLEVTTTSGGIPMTGGGIKLSVPDDWAPYIAWGTLGKLLSKEGPAQDLDRAQYCESRFREGIQLARLIAEALVL